MNHRLDVTKFKDHYVLLCPECGYRSIMYPDGKSMTLNWGDINATHSGAYVAPELGDIQLAVGVDVPPED
jgi:hypothetical protein